MPRLSRFIALFLLALWLPATQHCDLEAAGLAPASVTCQEEHVADTHAADNCTLVENGTYKHASALLKVPAPALAVACLCCLVELTPRPIFVPLVSPEQTDTPPELTRTWQFLARTALPARAPDARA